MPEQERIVIGDLLDDIAASVRGRDALELLADIVNDVPCAPWVGLHRRPSESPQLIAAYLRACRPFASQQQTRRSANKWIGAKPGVIHLLDVQLLRNEVRKGFADLGIDPPPSIGGNTRKTKAAGGRKEKFDDVIQRLANAAAVELATKGQRVTRFAILDRLKAWSRSPEILKAHSVQAIKFPGRDTLLVTVDEQDTRRTSFASFERYVRRAKKSP
jgi:hypothetical protein